MLHAAIMHRHTIGLFAHTTLVKAAPSRRGKLHAIELQMSFQHRVLVTMNRQSFLVLS
jgi:hypothetical protein